MRAILAVAAVAVLSAQTRHSFVIVPGRAFGPIRETTTRADLERLFGKRNLVDGEIAFPEAACAAGTVVYPDSKDEIEIAWQNPARTKVALVRSDNVGQWRTKRGIRNGTRLRELVRIAGHTLQFSGFGWDYGGQMDWTEGDGSMSLALRHAGSAPASALGDRLVASDMQGLNLDDIRVARLMQNWGDIWDVHDCHY